MADIDILVDSSQVKTAKQELQELENSFNSAYKSASVFTQAFKKAAAQSAADARIFRDIARANQEVINANLKVSNSYKSAQASADAFTEGLRKQEAQAFRTARANQDAINKQLGVSGPTALSSGAGFGALEAEALRLEAMYNKVALASRVYEQAQDSLNRAVMMGVITSDQAEAKLAEMSVAYLKVGDSADKAQAFINRFGENAQVSGRGLNQFGMYAQQVGYQVGDFLVQIQSGTNVLVAFGQQATQLAGLIPGVLGAALGIGISLATALGAAFMRTSESSTKSVEKTTDAVETLIKRTQEATAKIKELETGVPKEEQAVLDQINNLEAQRIVLIQEMLDKSYELQKLQEETGQDYSYILETYQDNIALLNEEIAAQKSIVKEAQAKETAYESALATNEKMLAVELGHARAAGQLVAAQKAVNAALASGDAENFHKAMNGALDAGIKFSQVDLNTVVAMAAKNGWSLAGALRAAWIAAQSGPLVNANPAAGPGFEKGGRSGSSMPSSIYAPVPTFDELYNRDIGNVGSSGGGGGAVSDPLQDLRDQLKLEEELLGLSEAQAQVLQALGEDRSRYSQAEIDAVTREIEAFERKKQVLEEQQGLYDTLKSSMEEAFMSIITGTESAKDAFKSMAYEVIKELYKVLVVQRMVGSFDTGTGVGSGLVGLISKGFSGLSSGGTMMANKPYLVGERGPELVIPRHSGTVVNANLTGKAGGSNGNLVVNNNITVTGSDAAMVRMEVAKMIPQITSATKAAVIDAKQRGGQMSSAFR